MIRMSAHGEGLVLLDIASGRIFVCNDTGARIWRGLANGCSALGISEEISRDYGVQKEIVQHDTDAFLHELDQLGFLVTEESQ